MRPQILGLHHDHIDGSRAMRDVILDLYRLAGRTFPFASIEEWLAFFRNPQEDITAKFGTVTGVMQSEEALELAGLAYGKRRAAEGFQYVEARFAPQYHTFGGLSLVLATAAMVRGLRRAESETAIKIMPILSIGREADEDIGAAIARVALSYDGAVGLDLACDEAAHPPEKHLKAYALTFGSKVRRDCHAGEWVAKEPVETYERRLLANVWTAIEVLKCHGIGHAIPLARDPELVARIAGEGIRVSGCPLSNMFCGLIGDVGELGIDTLLDRGVIYTLNPDDDLFMQPMSEVIRQCDERYRFTEAQCRKLEENVFRGAFAAGWRRP